MLDLLLTLGSIMFFILLIYAIQGRKIIYTKYPTSCKVTYIPEKENISLGPSNFNPSFQDIKTRENMN